VAHQFAAWARPRKAWQRAVARRHLEPLERLDAPGAHRGAAERRELREQVRQMLGAELQEQCPAQLHLERKS
jgi:hypothetical protein